MKDSYNIDVPNNKDLDEFKKDVEKLAKEGSPVYFRNSSISSATTVLENIFDYSDKYIYIYSKELAGDISNKPEYFERLKSALDSVIVKNPNIQIKVLLDKINKKSSLYKYFATLKNFKIKKSNSNFQAITKNSMNFVNINTENVGEVHFTIGTSKDNKINAIRAQYNESHKALCTFNDPNIVNHLKTIFEKEFNK